MGARSKSSRRWLDRQHKDPYTAQAKVQGFRSRAAFKLLEIQQRDRIFKQNMTVVDLGAAPGGWSQVAANLIGHKGKVFALDILPMDSLPGVDILIGDFQEEEVLAELKMRLQACMPIQPSSFKEVPPSVKEVPPPFSKGGQGGFLVHLVISDMAPNFSGIKAVDQPRIMLLAELALDFAEQVLCEGGTLLVKVFQGEGFQAYWAMLKKRFTQVIARKPKASRPESNEVYLVAKGYISSMRGTQVERYA